MNFDKVIKGCNMNFDKLYNLLIEKQKQLEIEKIFYKNNTIYWFNNVLGTSKDTWLDICNTIPEPYINIINKNKKAILSIDFPNEEIYILLKKHFNVEYSYDIITIASNEYIKSTINLKPSWEKPARIIKRGECKYWMLGNIIHREDGPAVECTNGDKAWYLNGELHREGGPARIFKDESQWWFNGKLHREGGPAIERTNGYKEWWLNGKEYSEQNYKNELIHRGIFKDPSLSDVMDAI